MRCSSASRVGDGVAAGDQQPARPRRRRTERPKISANPGSRNAPRVARSRFCSKSSNSTQQRASVARSWQTSCKLGGVSSIVGARQQRRLAEPLSRASRSSASATACVSAGGFQRPDMHGGQPAVARQAGQRCGRRARSCRCRRPRSAATPDTVAEAVDGRRAAAQDRQRRRAAARRRPMSSPIGSRRTPLPVGAIVGLGERHRRSGGIDAAAGRRRPREQGRARAYSGGHGVPPARDAAAARSSCCGGGHSASAAATGTPGLAASAS